jgi:hypothetical protein
VDCRKVIKYFMIIDKLRKIKFKKNISILILAVIICIVFNLLPNAAFASTFSWIEFGLLKMLGGLAQILVIIAGGILNLIIGSIIEIANYSNFANERDIIIGWTVVRDLCNMFFILGMMIIAFATILRVEKYSIKTMLPKLIIMAVLINFSRTLVALMIDFSQIIMLTFVKQFGKTGGEFIATLKVKEFLSASTDFSEYRQNDVSMNSTNTIAAIFIGVAFMIISAVVMLAILITFLMRMIMFWVLIVLSPLGFMLAAFPGGQKYASQYWGELAKYLINGPVLAFFVWLSLKTAMNFQLEEMKVNMSKCVSNIMCLDNFVGFVIAIGFLVGGLIVSQQIGGIGSGWGANTVKNLGQRGASLAKKAALLPVQLGAKGVKGGISWGARKFSANVMEIRPSKIIEGMKESFEKSKRDDDLKAKMRGGQYMNEGGLLGVVGGMGAGRDYWDRYLKWGGRRNLVDDFKSKGSLRELSGRQDKIINKRDKVVEEINALGNEAFSTQEIERFKQEKESNNERLNELYSKGLTEKDPEKKEKLQKETDELIARNSNLEAKINLEPNIAKDKLLQQKEKLETALSDLKKSRMEISPAQSYEVRSSYRSLVEEEKKKVASKTNADELLGDYESAKKNKDKYKVAAIAEKLFSDANGNELMNHAGKSSNAIGLRQFIMKDMVGSGLFTEKEGLMLQNDLSEAAERVNHWEMAKTVGMNEKGELESLVKQDKNGNWDDEGHVLAAAAEIYKMDPQVIARTLNRLAMGGETPDGKGGRRFDLSNLGKLLLNGLSNTFEDHEKRILQNVFANLSQPHVVKQMKEAGVSNKTINIMIRGGIKGGESTASGVLYERLKKEGKL